MKRLISFLIGTFCAVVWAWAQIQPNDVTMISYEQSWLDPKGTLALKNNTDKTLVEVSFRITYMDMQGQASDYEDFNISVEIAPGMSRKVDIPAYEHARYYHYYKTPDEFGNPAFKIKYELLDYRAEGNRKVISNDSMVGAAVSSEEDLQNVATAEADEKLDQEESKPLIAFKKISSFDQMILLWYALAFIIGMFFLVAIAAHDRSRSMSLWIIFSMGFTPIVALFLLVIFGDSHSGRRRQNPMDDEYDI